MRPRSSDSRLNVHVVLLQCAWLQDLEDDEIASVDKSDPGKNGGNLVRLLSHSSKTPKTSMIFWGKTSLLHQPMEPQELEIELEKTKAEHNVKPRSGDCKLC